MGSSFFFSPEKSEFSFVGFWGGSAFLACAPLLTSRGLTGRSTRLQTAHLDQLTRDSFLYGTHLCQTITLVGGCLLEVESSCLVSEKWLGSLHFMLVSPCFPFAYAPRVPSNLYRLWVRPSWFLIIVLLESHPVFPHVDFADLQKPGCEKNGNSIPPFLGTFSASRVISSKLPACLCFI